MLRATKPPWRHFRPTVTPQSFGRNYGRARSPAEQENTMAKFHVVPSSNQRGDMASRAGADRCCGVRDRMRLA
jgi:hypothetical protein